MQRLHDVIGRELAADSANRTLRDVAQAQRAAAVGAVHVTCSDEAEREAVESFQHWFANALLPELKFWSKSPFRTANLGGRYEWGAIRIAEQHYTTPATRAGFKLLVVKVNSHVSVMESAGQTIYGQMDRYECDSPCCGALHALLDGQRHPAMDELRTAFSYDGVARLDLLRDDTVVAPETRSFVAAVVNARLQARSAIVDIQDYVPESPTVYIVLPCVSLNRKQRDSEFIVGMYWSDSRNGAGEAQYIGLGDDPSCYRVFQHHGHLRVEDDHLGQPREARNHRQEVARQWRARHPEFQVVQDPRFAEIASKTRNHSGYSATMARETLKTLLWLAADIAPVPASILLFTKGLVGVHRLYQAHRLARGAGGGGAQAREIIEEAIDRIAKMPADQARGTIEAIMDHFQPAPASDSA